MRCTRKPPRQISITMWIALFSAPSKHSCSLTRLGWLREAGAEGGGGWGGQAEKTAGLALRIGLGPGRGGGWDRGVWPGGAECLGLDLPYDYYYDNDDDNDDDYPLTKISVHSARHAL